MGSNYKVANDGQAKILIQNGTVDPATTQAGELFYRTDEDSLAVSNGTNFTAVRGGSVRKYREKVNETPNGIVTAFTVDFPYVPTTTEVYINGVLQEITVDYTESSAAGGEVTFTTAPLTGAIVTISYSRLEGSSLPLFNKFDVEVGVAKQTYSGSTTVFDIPFPYTVGAGNLLVYSSGTLMLVGGTEDYVETDLDTITFNSARTAGEIIQFIKVGAANDQGTSGWLDSGTTVVLSTTTDQVQVGVGSAATPSLAFDGDSDTGFYRSGVDTIVLVTGGSDRWQIDSGGALNSLSSAVLGLSDGTVGTPGLQFVGDTNTGIYRPGADQVSITLGGFTNLVLTNTTIEAGNSNPAFRASDGTVGAPSISFKNDTDTGIFLSGTPGIIFSSAGVRRGEISSAGLEVTPDGSAAAPAINIGGDADTGIFRGGANRIDFSNAGVNTYTFESGGLVTAGPTTSAFRQADGTLSLPSYAFVNDTDTGMYRRLSNSIGMSCAGISVFDFNSTVNRSHVNMEVLGQNSPQVKIEASVNNTASVILKHPTREWNLGTVGTTSLFIRDNTAALNRWEVNTSGQMLPVGDGSAGTPIWAFGLDPDTGIYRPASNNLAISAGGNLALNVLTTGVNFYAAGSNIGQFSATSLIPAPDNTLSLGTGSLRWTEVFAVAGSINTSHSTTKYDIKPLEDIEIPTPVRFKRKDDKDYRKGREYIGYLNDSLPPEARALNQDGTFDETGNYENSVVGILCQAVKKLQAEIKELKAQANN